MKFIFVAKLEIIFPIDKEKVDTSRIRNYSINSEWELADEKHPQFKNFEVVLIHKQNRKWLGLSFEEVNRSFDIILKK